MERAEAKRRLKLLIGKDLREVAEELKITIFSPNGKKNKGWVGHTIERFLGLPLNSSRSPNFGSWELKVVSLKYLKNKKLTVKETMAVTMIDPYNVARTEFENSHLLSKLRKILIPARIWISANEESSVLYNVTEFDLDNEIAFSQIKADYDLVKDTINTRGFSALTGKMGQIVKPRTKGAGHGSQSRAFYVRTFFLKDIVFQENEN